MPIYPRSNMRAHQYFRVCHNTFRRIKELEKELENFYPYQGIYHEDYTKQEKYNMEHNDLIPIVIVFAAMSLEAFFYDYALSKRIDIKVPKGTSVLDKWLIYIEHATGVTFDVNLEPFLQVRMLIKARNELVHAKSLFNSIFTRNISEDIEDEYEEDDHFDVNAKDLAIRGTTFYDVCNNAVTIIGTIMQEMDKIDTSKPSWTMFRD